jgi:hypothetical protein
MCQRGGGGCVKLQSVKLAITTVTATLALGVAGVFAMTGTAAAQGYTCDSVIYVDSGTMGVGNCVPDPGTPAVGPVSAPFTIVARDNGVRYPCGPAIQAGRQLALSAVSVAPTATVGLICVPPLPRYLPALP